MNYLHYEFDLGPDDVVEVTLDARANVLLLDAENFRRYQDGKHCEYHGGYAKVSPVEIPAPTSGHWHLVVDLGGYPGSVSASARILQGAT